MNEKEFFTEGDTHPIVKKNHTAKKESVEEV